MTLADPSIVFSKQTAPTDPFRCLAFKFGDQVSSRKEVRLEIDPIIHENYYSPKPRSNDIALLKLAEEVDLKIYTPACLPSIGADYTGQNGRVYGKTPLRS